MTREGSADPREALYWEAVEGGGVRCLLCPHGCRLAEGRVGLCRVRKNVAGTLRTLNYARVSSANLDPIEKKPLFHFHPGSLIYSLGTIGCNLSCAFCQNWSISQGDVPTQFVEPQQAVSVAAGHKGNIGIAYTYNEPFIWYEFVLETAVLAREAGLTNVLVTNGYVSEDPLRELLPHIDAMNVDIKAMGERFYRELCGGRPEHPRRTAEIAKEAGCHVEVTNLVIPNWNDAEDDIRHLVDWVAQLGPDVPLHFSRYHPDYKLTEPATPTATLTKARELALEKLDYVYIGNVWSPGGEDTVCPRCGKVVVARSGFSVAQVSVKDGRCPSCGEVVPIVGT
jgi:pyruvate formate lyase activating enzyme